MTPSSSGQSLHDLVKVNNAARLKFDVRSFQVIADALAKLVGGTNPFPGH
jgi:hypothetical protein